jgi:hypothetical protein
MDPEGIAMTQPAPTTHPPAPDEPDDPLPSCRCGTNAESKFCVADRAYSFVRLLYLLWGGTSVPTKVSFRCVKCGETFEALTDPALCRLYIL